MSPGSCGVCKAPHILSRGRLRFCGGQTMSNRLRGGELEHLTVQLLERDVPWSSDLIHGAIVLDQSTPSVDQVICVRLRHRNRGDMLLSEILKCLHLGPLGPGATVQVEHQIRQPNSLQARHDSVDCG